MHEITSNHHLTPYKPTREKVKEYLSRTGASIHTRFSPSLFPNLDTREHPIVKLASSNPDLAASTDISVTKSSSNNNTAKVPNSSGLKIIVKNVVAPNTNYSPGSSNAAELAEKHLLDENNNESTNISVDSPLKDKKDDKLDLDVNEEESAPNSLKSISNISE